MDRTAIVGDDKLRYKNPLSYIKDSFGNRQESSNYNLGGSPSYDTWFRGDITLFGGIEYSLPKFNKLSLKIENDPFDYFDYMCCGEGLSLESFKLRPKDSSYNFGLRYKFKDYGNVDISFIKGNTWNLSFSIGFSSKKPLFVKNKFEPKVIDKNYNENKRMNFILIF